MSVSPEEKIQKRLERKNRFHQTRFYRFWAAKKAKWDSKIHALVYKEVVIDLSTAQDGSDKRTIIKKRPIGLIASLTGFVLVLILCFLPLNYYFRFFNWNMFADAFHGLFVPSGYRLKTTAEWWAYSWEMFTTQFAQLFEVCFLGTFFGALISIPIYYLCARNVTHSGWLRTPSRILNDFLRTIPMFLIGLLISQVFAIGNSIDAVLTMVVFTVGIMYQMMYEYIETLEMSPFEAVRSCGGNALQCVNLGLHPEVKPMFFAYFIYTLEINIRASIILYYVGFEGYIRTLMSNISNRYWDLAGSMLLPLLIVVAILQFTSNMMARKLR